MPPVIFIYAVIKGYHVYKVRPSVGSKLKCEPNLDNPVDVCAMGVYDSQGALVGHVPANPVPLHKALFDLWKQMHLNISCIVTDSPHTSQSPWPEVRETGGGAVIPCLYRVECISDKENVIWQTLSDVSNQKPGIICLQKISGSEVSGLSAQLQELAISDGDDQTKASGDRDSEPVERPTCFLNGLHVDCHIGPFTLSSVVSTATRANVLSVPVYNALMCGGQVRRMEPVHYLVDMSLGGTLHIVKEIIVVVTIGSKNLQQVFGVADNLLAKDIILGIPLLEDSRACVGAKLRFLGDYVDTYVGERPTPEQRELKKYYSGLSDGSKSCKQCQNAVRRVERRGRVIVFSH